MRDAEGDGAGIGADRRRRRASGRRAGPQLGGHRQRRCGGAAARSESAARRGRRSVVPPVAWTGSAVDKPLVAGRGVPAQIRRVRPSHGGGGTIHRSRCRGPGLPVHPARQEAGGVRDREREPHGHDAAQHATERRTSHVRRLRSFRRPIDGVPPAIYRGRTPSWVQDQRCLGCVRAQITKPMGSLARPASRSAVLAPSRGHAVAVEAVGPERDPDLARILKAKNLTDANVDEVLQRVQWAWVELNYRPHAYQAADVRTSSPATWWES